MEPTARTERRNSRTGRPPIHGLNALRKAVTRLSTKRLDQRSAIAVAVRRFKADLVRDLGGNPSRAQETLIELAARTWIIVEALDDWLMRQPSLVLHRKRAVVPVLLQRQQLADSLARQLERLGLERKVREAPDVTSYLASRGVRHAAPTGVQSADGRGPEREEAPDETTVGDAAGEGEPTP